MAHYIVDMRSDTVSLPTPEMRKAMAEAPVGDDVYGEDPTINELERKTAELFGKEAALFVPTGTMANLLAVMVHCHQRGSEAIVGDLSHTFLYDQANAAQIAGVQLSTVKNRTDGTFCLDELRKKIRWYDDYHEPRTALVVVENTHNMCGGKVIPLEWLDKLVALCRTSEKPIALHMDGARVFNAAEALQLPVARIVRDFDTVCFCLSKGLSAPVGSILLGSKAIIKEARRLRKALGGGMRQAGILAAAGLVALETILPRLKVDHQKTRRIAEALHNLQSPNILIDLPTVQTNILLINMQNPKLSGLDFARRCAEVTEEELKDGIVTADNQGIVLKISSRNWRYSRIVIYHQISDQDVEYAIKKMLYVARQIDATHA